MAGFLMVYVGLPNMTSRVCSTVRMIRACRGSHCAVELAPNFTISRRERVAIPRFQAWSMELGVPCVMTSAAAVAVDDSHHG